MLSRTVSWALLLCLVAASSAVAQTSGGAGKAAPTLVREDTIRLAYGDSPNDKAPYISRGVKVFSDNSTVDHGLYTRYWRNGQKAEEGRYVDGKKQGPWKLWYKNGQEAKTENYVDGKLDGKWTLVSEDGKPLRERSYKAEQRDGKWLSYYPGGKQVQLEENYGGGKLNGAVRVWYESGAKDSERNYVNGVPEGKQQQWHENGKLGRESEYRNGRRNGMMTEWDKEGKVVKQSEYKDGKLVDKSSK